MPAAPHKRPGAKTAADLRRRPVQRRSQAKVDAILRAAIRILANEGYAAASTVKIADLAGVSVGSVYAYFPDKDAIFRAYVNQRVGEIFQNVAANVAALNYNSVEQAVRAIIEASVVFSIDNKKSLSAMVGKIPGVYDGLMLQSVMQQLYAAAETFYRAHGLAKTQADAKRMTYVLANAVTGFFIRIVTDPDLPLDKRELTDELVNLVLGYIQRIAPIDC